MSTVALIDDHESVRLGLEAACLRDGEQRVVFSGGTVKEYLTWRATSSEPPVDVVVLDLTLGDGTTVTENVTTLVADGASVVIHSVADRPASVREALVAGAAGVVSKSSTLDDVLEAIHTVARGEALNNVEWASAVDGDREFADAQLSTREREVLRLYAAGLPLKAVAERHEQLGEDWLIAVTTDHGHRPEGGHGEDEVEVRRSFLIVHRVGAPLPEAVARRDRLRSHEVMDLLLGAVGARQGSMDADGVGVLRDIEPVGPTRNLAFEW